MHCCERLPAQDRTGCDRPPSSFCRGSAKTRTPWCRTAARTASGSAGVGLRASGWRGVFGVKGERSLECSGDDALTQALSGQFPGRWPREILLNRLHLCIGAGLNAQPRWIGPLFMLPSCIPSNRCGRSVC